VYTADEIDTLCVIAAKYKTACEDIIALNKQLADRKVQPGDEIRVPMGDRRKSSRNRDSLSFISGLSMSFLEDDDMAEGMDVAESRCLILNSTPSGPKTVIQ
jgi:LysM repeat protein